MTARNERLEALTQDQREAVVRGLAVRRQEASEGGGGQACLAPAAVLGERLSRSEESALRRTLRSPTPSGVNQHVTWCLKRPCDPDSLEQSLENLAARFPGLRTGLERREGQACRLVDPDPVVDLLRLDVSDLPPAGREARAAELLDREVREQFELDAPPLWKAVLLRLDEDRDWLTLVAHPLAADAAALERLGGLALAEHPDPGGAVETAAEVAAAEERELGSGWRERAAAALSPPADLALEYPVDDLSPPRAAPGVTAARRLLPTELAGSLSEVGPAPAPGLRAGAALVALLSRYRGVPEGALEWLERPAGPAPLGAGEVAFPLRLDCPPELPGRALVEAATAAREQGLARAWAPQDLCPLGVLYRPPASTAAAGAPGERLWLPIGAAEAHLEFGLESRGGEWALTLLARDDRVATSTAARILEHWERTLEGLLRAPDAPLADLPALEARGAVCSEAVAEPAPPLAELMEQVRSLEEAAPGAVALHAWDQVLTRTELGEQYRALAAELAKAPGVVSLELPPGPALVVALLAALEAGVAPVVLDPRDPEARRQRLRSEAGGGLRVLPGKQGSGHRLESTGAGDETPLPPDVVIRVPVGPRLVAVEGTSLARRVAWLRAGMGASAMAAGRSLLRLPVTAPGLLAELLAGLAQGLELEVLEASSSRDPWVLAGKLGEGTVWTSGDHQLLRLLLDRGADLQGLGGWVVEGEPPPRAVIERFREQAPGARLGVLAGPPELAGAAVGSWLLEPGRPLPSWTRGELGRPLPGVSLRVLGPDGEPVVRGLPGELRAGELESRGGFGLRGRQLGDGRLAVEGPSQRWASLAGELLDLDWLEAELLEHPDVLAARVEVVGEEDLRRRLFAWCQVREGGGRGRVGQRVRRWLRDRVPGAWLPSTIAGREFFPRDSLGRISIHELPPPRSSLVPLRRGGSQRPVYLIHGMGGTVIDLVNMGPHFSAQQPVLALQSRAVDGISPADGSVKAQAAHYLEEIRSLQPVGPYSICGYSAGGITAFEMACQLRRAGEQVDHLFLLDTFGPKTRWRRHEKLAFLRLILTITVEVWRRRWRAGWSVVWNAVKVEFGTRIRRALGLTSGRRRARTEKERLDRISFLNQQAQHSYVPSVYPGKISLFLSEELPPPPDGAELSIDDWMTSFTARALGSTRELWEELSEEPMEIRKVGGNHFDLISVGNARALAEELEQALVERRGAQLSDRPPVGTAPAGGSRNSIVARRPTL